VVGVEHLVVLIDPREGVVVLGQLVVAQLRPVVVVERQL